MHRARPRGTIKSRSTMQRKNKRTSLRIAARTNFTRQNKFRGSPHLPVLRAQDQSGARHGPTKPPERFGQFGSKYVFLRDSNMHTYTYGIALLVFSSLAQPCVFCFTFFQRGGRADGARQRAPRPLLVGAAVVAAGSWSLQGFLVAVVGGKKRVKRKVTRGKHYT